MNDDSNLTRLFILVSLIVAVYIFIWPFWQLTANWQILDQKPPSQDQQIEQQIDYSMSQKSSTSSVPDTQLAILSELNNERLKYGLAPLSLDPRITPVSQSYAQEMVDLRYYGHIDLENGHAWDRLEQSGSKCQSPSYENLARYRYTGPSISETFAKEIVTGWMNSSSGHKYPILDTNSKKVGIGIGKGSAYSCYHDTDSNIQICDPDVDDTWNQIIIVADFCG
ncbi:Cysteine-rich secretory protein family protein [Candidatus Bilamarchaeum dharawalense]|uniref:Cysteine-rich secretory protein family protein n=1 Tax=Candidatus Bilamarchaeum dharawalense TaxID=2885759 RepID=A0A5E4LU16_9ARCH|nr:Cysteine-rich secretory protein family protein [Candidatus Bilamarchaeum dharawalense]